MVIGARVSYYVLYKTSSNVTHLEGKTEGVPARWRSNIHRESHFANDDKEGPMAGKWKVYGNTGKNKLKDMLSG